MKQNIINLVVFMGIYSEDILAEIRDRANIVDVISEYTSLKKRGDSYVGICPFHSEKTPSFNVNLDKQLFYCFGCGTGGNIFSFIMKKENLTFPEAVRWLAERYHIELPKHGRAQEVSKGYAHKQELYRVNEWAAKFFHHMLTNTKEGNKALDYLLKRGLKQNTIDDFMLGFADMSWDSLKNKALGQGISRGTLAELGLIVERKDRRGFYDRFRGRIMFPIHDRTNKVIAFGGRSLDDQGPKYLNSPETPIFKKGEHLYALPKITKDPLIDVIVVEGYMDCISLHQKGFSQALATLGTAFTPYQAKLLKRYSDGAVLAFDADQAGRKAILKSIELLYEVGFSPKVLSLPEGKDPDDFLLLYGADAFGEQLAKARDHVHYRWDMIENGLDINSPDGKIRFIKAAISVLLTLSSTSEREIYIRDLADRLEISINSIQREVAKIQLPANGYRYKKSHTRDNNRGIHKIKPLKGFHKAEKNLLKAMIEEKWVMEKYHDNISSKYFLNPNTRKIADLVIDKYQREKINPSDLYNYLDDEACKELTDIIISKISFKSDMIDELINSVKISYLNHSIDDVRNRLQKADLVGNKEEIDSLLNIYQTMKSEMNRLKKANTPGKGGA